MKYYEVTCLVNPDIGESEVKNVSQKLGEYISSSKGEILHRTENLSRIKLARPIKNKDWAFLVSLNFNLEPSELEEINQKIKKEENILRHIIVTDPYKGNREQKIISRTSAFRRTSARTLSEKDQIIERRQKDAPQKAELKELDQKIEEMLGQ